VLPYLPIDGNSLNYSLSEVMRLVAAPANLLTSVTHSGFRITPVVRSNEATRRLVVDTTAEPTSFAVVPTWQQAPGLIWRSTVVDSRSGSSNSNRVIPLRWSIPAERGLA